MEYDTSICKIRKETDLPCHGCAFFEKCPKKDQKIIETRKKLEEEPQKAPAEPKKRKRLPWTVGDIAVMSNPEYTSVEAAEIIGRNKYTVIKWRQRNNIKTPIGRRKK
jgi:hypothetical protein